MCFDIIVQMRKKDLLESLLNVKLSLLKIALDLPLKMVGQSHRPYMKEHNVLRCLERDFAVN